ncbi:MAG TPA: translocation/assembly module TamB domain-containing protein, partial [Candidatus Tumulicola sp.]|nr:translocation/assembly module TamB domain-containing protein [Candidatus Tumulicola sp.]
DLARAGVQALAGAAGYRLAYRDLQIGASGLTARDLRVANARGEPIAAIGTLALSYSLRDLLPGGSHAFGLTGFDVERARLTLIRHPDGTFNVALPTWRSGGRAASAPLNFRGRLRDVSIDIDDRAQGVASARHLRFSGIGADLDVHSAGRTVYRAQVTYVENGRRFPVFGSGDIDVPGGFGLQRWYAPQLPIARIVDFALNSPSFHVAGGSLRGSDVRIAALPNAAGELQQHVSAVAAIDRARIGIGGLVKPLRNVNGTVAAYGDGLLLQNVHATIAGMSVRLDGGVYHLAAPQLRLAVAGSGDLHDLRGALTQAGALPLAGPARLDVAVEGSPSKPLTLIAVRSPRIAYGPAAFEATRALVALDGDELDVLHAGARYASIGVSAFGRFGLHPRSNALELVGALDAPPGALPYAGAVAPGLPLHLTALLTGERPSTARARGILFGSDAQTALAGTFDLRSPGVGRIGPLRLSGPNESLYAVASIDRPRRKFDAYADARNLRVANLASAPLPGLKIAALPSFGATVDATLSASSRDGRVRALADAGLHNLAGIGRIDAAAVTLSYDRGTLHIGNAIAAGPGTYAHADGRIAGLPRSPRYDLNADVHSADVAAWTAHVSHAAPIEGTLEARLHVSGAGHDPIVAGNLNAPEGAVNGLAFHDLHATVAGSPGAISLRDGSIVVGSSTVAFSGDAAESVRRLNVSAPHVDLRDFNDYFDRGDMLGGEGSLQTALTLSDGRIAATSGSLALHDAAIRNVRLGTANARWSGTGSRIVTAAAFSGDTGRVSANGTVALGGSLDLVAHARDVNLAQWLPVAGISAPVGGVASADAVVNGRYPDLNATVSAQATHANLGRVPVQQLSMAATMRAGLGRLERATLVIPHGRISGSGTFGLRAGDPLALAFHATSEDVASLATTLTGKPFDAGGTLDSTLHVGGTRAQPELTDDFAVRNARYKHLALPRIAGRLHADRRSIALTSGEIDLTKGRLLAAAALPIRLSPLQIDGRNRPIQGTVVADDVEASNLTPLLPQGTTLSGRADGRIALAGTLDAPRLSGGLDFSKGYYSGPQERTPLQNVAASLRFSGTSVRLENARADAGGGQLSAGGRASIPSIRALRDAQFALNLRADRVVLDLPQYVKGRFDGSVALSRAPRAAPRLGGNVTLSAARIALDALYNPKPANGPAPSLPDAGFDLQMTAGRDVRVVSSNVDVGTQGSMHVGGSLRAPALSGTFESTGGTIDFLRDFRIARARVAFDPADGVVPTVNATATTYVSDPSTNVRIHVTGPATGLNVAFTSDPPYDREQILGLLVNAQSVGAVRGVAATRGGSFAPSNFAEQMAGSRLNTVFTRNLLEPLSVALGSGLGLQNLQIANDVTSGLGINAVKAFGKYVNVVFDESFNEVRRTSWSLQAHPTAGTRFDLTAYTQQNQNAFALSLPPAQYSIDGAAVTTPMNSGTNGVDFTFRRTFP